MKIRFIALGITCSAFVLMIATSCTREYICRCTWTHSGAPGLPQGEVREYPITDSKKNAESKCKGNSRKYESGGIVTEEDCALF